MNIVGNSLGNPLCNPLGHLMHPVDSTGYPFVEKTVVLEVSNYYGYTGSGSARLYGFGGQSVSITATSPISAKQSAIVRVPSTATWSIDVCASTPSFDQWATGTGGSAYTYSEIPIVSGVKYTIPSSSPDTITIRVRPATSDGITIVQDNINLPPRSNAGAGTVGEGIAWDAECVVPDGWSANDKLSGLRGYYNTFISGTDNTFYSSNHYCLDANKFRSLNVKIDGYFQYRGNDSAHNSVTANLMKGNSPLVTYRSATTTGNGVEEFHMTASLPTSVSEARYLLRGSIDGYTTAERGRMWGATWGFTGVVK